MLQNNSTKTRTTQETLLLYTSRNLIGSSCFRDTHFFRLSFQFSLFSVVQWQSSCCKERNFCLGFSACLLDIIIILLLLSESFVFKYFLVHPFAEKNGFQNIIGNTQQTGRQATWQNQKFLSPFEPKTKTMFSQLFPNGLLTWHTAAQVKDSRWERGVQTSSADFQRLTEPCLEHIART